MEITFKSKKFAKICNSEKELVRAYGKTGAEKIRRRLDDLAAASDLDVLRPPFPGRCHELKQNRDGQLSLDVEQPYRLIFELSGEDIKYNENGGLDWKSVKAVKIIDVENTHD